MKTERVKERKRERERERERAIVGGVFIGGEKQRGPDWAGFLDSVDLTN